MILRRFMQHVRDQNWFAVGIDVVVVFGSVLLATQIAVAIEDAKARRDLTLSVQNLSAEISREAQWTQSTIGWQKRNMKHLRETLEILDGASPDDFDLPLIFAALSFGVNTPYARGDYPTLDEMINTGRFKDIPHKELQGMLMELINSANRAEDMNQRRDARADSSPLNYDFLEWELYLDKERAGGWGFSIINGVDWVRARKSKDFRFRVQQAHSGLAQNVRDMHWLVQISEEVSSELVRLGYEPSTAWILKNDWSPNKWYEDEQPEAE